MTLPLKYLKDKNFYPVRSGNDLRKLKEWIKDAQKEYPEQKFKIKKAIDKRMLKDIYWKKRVEAGYEDLFMAYGSY